MLKRFFLVKWFLGWYNARCCVCGGFSIWPFNRLSQTNTASKYNPRGKAVLIHSGWCASRHLRSANHGFCCVCGGDHGRLGYVDGKNEYNPDGQLRSVHGGSCLVQYVVSYFTGLVFSDRW
ncbi:MAG: hypothetical protein WC508_00355 [Patescibacteria group bacterium]